MQTNEELAMLAKDGDMDAMAGLWKQNYGLLFLLMRRFFPLCPRYGLTEDDLMQEAYFALVRAVGAYEPGKGLVFTSYLSYHVRTAAHNAFAYGHRGRRNDLPPRVVSLDDPLPGTEDLTVGDMIKDEQAAAAMEQPVEDLQRAQLCACLDDCMRDMDPAMADTIRARFLEGKTLQAIAAEQNTSREHVRQLES